MWCVRKNGHRGNDLLVLPDRTFYLKSFAAVGKTPSTHAGTALMISVNAIIVLWKNSKRRRPRLPWTRPGAQWKRLFLLFRLATERPFHYKEQTCTALDLCKNVKPELIWVFDRKSLTTLPKFLLLKQIDGPLCWKLHDFERKMLDELRFNFFRLLKLHISFRQ